MNLPTDRRLGAVELLGHLGEVKLLMRHLLRSPQLLNIHI